VSFEDTRAPGVDEDIDISGPEEVVEELD